MSAPRIDANDRNTAALFGDGAGAVVCAAGAAGEAGTGGARLRRRARRADRGRSPHAAADDGRPRRPSSSDPASVPRCFPWRLCRRPASRSPTHRPARVSPGQHADPHGAQRAARVATRSCRGLHRHARQHVGGERAARARQPRRRDGRLRPGMRSVARGRRIGVHVGRLRGRNGGCDERAATTCRMRARAGHRWLARCIGAA